MKKQLIYPLAILAICQLPARGQGQPPPSTIKQPSFSRWSIDLSLAPAFPVGKFGDKHYPDNEAGYARAGLNGELTVTYRLCHAVGLVIAAAEQENPMANIVSITSPGFTPLTVDNDHYTITRLLAGGAFSHRLSSHGLSLRFHVLAGILKTSIPGFSYTYLSNTTGSRPESGRADAVPLPWNFCYEGGAGLRWQSAGRLFLLLDAAYAGANPDFHYNYSIKVNGNFFTSGEAEKKLPTGTIQLRLGAGLRL